MKPQRGFTLIEAMLALGLSLVLLSAAVVMLIGAQQTAATLAATARAQANLQLAFSVIERGLQRAGNFGCVHPQRPLFTMLRGALSQLPEYDLSRPVVGYEALAFGGYAPNPAATLPLSGAGGDYRVHHAGHGIDLDKLKSGADLLVVRVLGPSAPLGAASADFAPLVVLGEALEYAADDVVLVSDCEQATLLKVTAIETLASGAELSWADGPGPFDNSRAAVAVGSSRQRAAAVPKGYGADAMVALVETLFFYLAPSLVENRQGNLATALWLKRGPARGVELFAGIDNLQVWFLAAAGAESSSPIGYFDTQHLPAQARIVGIRVLLRSTSIDGLGVFADQPLSFTGVRTFMLPRFAEQGWPL